MSKYLLIAFQLSHRPLTRVNRCYCDNTIRSPGSKASSGCDMTCSGNSTEFCGGPNRLTLYESSSPSTPGIPGIPAGWSDLGCFTDNGGARTLGTQQEVPGGYTNMTVERCLGVCANQGYAYGGVEYSQECYCGNAILNGGACADQSSCYMPCKGNTAETCGGPNRLNVYFAGSSQSSCAVRPTPSSSSTSITSSSAPVLVTSATSSSTISSSSSIVVSSSTTLSSSTIISSSTSTSTGEIMHAPWTD
jgi:hypothetical protein